MNMGLDLEALERVGYCFARRVFEADLSHIAQRLGSIRVDPRSPEPIRSIRPQAASIAKANTLSSRYGTGSFPFHSDTAHWERPARYLLLFCVDPGEGMRPTLLQDSREWRLDTTEMGIVCRALWAVGHRRPHLSTVGVRLNKNLLIRYDMDCMHPLTAEARELRELLDERIRSRPFDSIEWRRDSLLVIDNHRMVHARGRAKRPDPGRVLKRILIGET